MRLDLTGHPLHTRAMSITVGAETDGTWTVVGELVDVRKRGFTPVGTELQGAGIIHQMGLEAGVDPRRGVIERVTARQSVVAFEASAATLGESCRDVVAHLAELRGMRLDDAALLRTVMGGAAGCSHLLAVAQLLCATLTCVALDPVASSDAVHRQLLRRDLIVDGSEQDDGRLAIAIQLSDLFTAPAAGGDRAMARFRGHEELRLSLILDGWPATIVAARGAERSRTGGDFAAAGWRDLDVELGALRGLSLGKGAAQALVAAVGANPRVRDALLQLGGALIQCRASFPDKWLNVAAAPGHQGLIGMADSCYMWRRGGALERAREKQR
jgi:Protein of unknown function (DUF2889)